MLVNPGYPCLVTQDLEICEKSNFLLTAVVFSFSYRRAMLCSMTWESASPIVPTDIIPDFLFPRLAHLALAPRPDCNPVSCCSLLLALGLRC